MRDDAVYPSTRMHRNSARLLKRIYRAYFGNQEASPDNYWSLCRVPRETLRHVTRSSPDIVNLHWLGDSFFRPSDIPRLTMPVVWTLHDMWALTGGCHYSGDCTKFELSCGSCPQLRKSHRNDASAKNWNFKHRQLKNSDIVVVAPSRWLANCSIRSSLLRDFRTEVIPYGLDTECFPGQLIR